MNVRYFKEYSSFLNRDMEFKMYGHAGTLCLVLPCQDGRFFEWEDRHMYDQVSDLIEQGRIQFVSVDSVDLESWSSYGDSPSRMQMQENYVQYIMNELIPSALYKAGKPQDEAMMVLGASMGAFHAGNFFFRYPGRFKQVLALSGLYDMSRYFYDGTILADIYRRWIQRILIFLNIMRRKRSLWLDKAHGSTNAPTILESWPTFVFTKGSISKRIFGDLMFLTIGQAWKDRSKNICQECVRRSKDDRLFYFFS